MDIEEVRKLVQRLDTDLVASRAELDEVTHRVAGLEKVIEGYVQMYPDLLDVLPNFMFRVPSDGSDPPTVAQSVRVVMQERPGVWWLVSELVESLLKRGWKPSSDNPANAVRTALERMVASPATSDIYKERKWREDGTKVAYCYDPDRPPPDPARPTEAPAEYQYEEEPF